MVRRIRGHKFVPKKFAEIVCHWSFTGAWKFVAAFIKESLENNDHIMKSKFMNYPSMSLPARVLIFVIAIWTLSNVVDAQKNAAPQAASADIDQCKNGTSVAPAVCTGSAWVNGNVGHTNSNWAENEFNSYRLKFSGFTPGATVHSVTIGYDIFKSGKHAIDYLGTFDATETTSNPCSGVSGCALGSPSDTISIPLDTATVTNKLNPNTNSPVFQIPGQFTMWGGDLLTVAYEPYGGGDERLITLTFTASVANPVIAWSGHIGWRGSWGAGNSAGGINGSSYHMRLDNLDGSGGSQDLPMDANAVITSGAVFIKKEVNSLDPQNPTSSSIAFPFKASENFGTTDFWLVDDDTGPGIDIQQSQTITTFGDENKIIVTEGTLPTGWTLANVNCVEDGIADSTQNSLGPSAIIIVQPGEIVTCTFTNTQLTPSAALVSVGGRVVDSAGRSLSGVRVTLTDSNDNVRTAISSNFGYYRFDEVESGHLYVISAASKRYTFQNHVISVLDDLTEFDLTSIE